MASRFDHHQRAPRRLTLLSAAACVVLAGCGTGLGNADAQVIAAVDITLAAPAFTLSTVADLSVGPTQFRLSAAGSADYPNLIADMAVSIESGAEGGGFEIRSDGSTVWVRAEGDVAAELDLPNGKRWVEGNAERLTELGSFDQSGLLGVLLTLRAADGTETVGTDDLDGVEVTRYRTSVTYDDALKAAGADADALKQALSLDAPTPVDLDIDVAVGADGVIREFVLTADANAGFSELTADYRVILTDVGREVDVPDAPPPDETVTGPQADAIFDALSD